jgi:TRAP-type C4-dicarboxylate transport system permease small subunit
MPPVLGKEILYECLAVTLFRVAAVCFPWPRLATIWQVTFRYIAQFPYGFAKEE